ncbi:MAG: dipeptide epimerase, partial [Alphaproteobacteria bacterium]
MPQLEIYLEEWPIRGTFTISRGSRTKAEVVVVELNDGAHLGRGECVPYARYGESLKSVQGQIESLAGEITSGLSRDGLQDALPAGAARNALDCAMWDLDAKSSGSRVWELAGLPAPHPLTSAYTLSLDTPSVMQSAACDNAARPLLKLKLAGPDDLARVEAVRLGAPDAAIIVDANEGWTPEIYADLAPKLAALGVKMIEQPLPAGDDAALAEMVRPVPVCADESCHDRASLPGLEGRYDMLNIKLDKTGGLTEA